MDRRGHLVKMVNQLLARLGLQGSRLLVHLDHQAAMPKTQRSLLTLFGTKASFARGFEKESLSRLTLRSRRSQGLSRGQVVKRGTCGSTCVLFPLAESREVVTLQARLVPRQCRRNRQLQVCQVRAVAGSAEYCVVQFAAQSGTVLAARLVVPLEA